VSEQPALPMGLQTAEVRVYYEPDSGRVVHVHQLVSAPGEELDAQRIEDEMAAFEEVLRSRHPGILYLVVAADDLPRSGQGMRVDVERTILVRDAMDQAT
jgi:hypothetical protein